MATAGHLIKRKQHIFQPKNSYTLFVNSSAISSMAVVPHAVSSFQSYRPGFARGAHLATVIA